MKVTLPLGVGKYQICSVDGCGKDAVTEFYAMDPKGGLVCMGACEEHINDVRALTAGIALKAWYSAGSSKGVAKDHIFKSGSSEEGKSKGEMEPRPPLEPQSAKAEKAAKKMATKTPRKTTNENEKEKDALTVEAPENEAPPAPPEKEAAPKGKGKPAKPVKELAVPNPVKARASWRWSDAPGTWMTVGGKEVPLSELSDDELMGAATALFDAHYQRARGEAAWVRTLDLVVPYTYPEKEISVGKAVANPRLAEFHQECARRNLCEPLSAE